MALLSDALLPFPPGSRVLFSGKPHNGVEATALKMREATAKKAACLMVQFDVGNDGGRNGMGMIGCVTIGNGSTTQAMRLPPLALRPLAPPPPPLALALAHART